MSTGDSTPRTSASVRDISSLEGDVERFLGDYRAASAAAQSQTQSLMQPTSPPVHQPQHFLPPPPLPPRQPPPLLPVYASATATHSHGHSHTHAHARTLSPVSALLLNGGHQHSTPPFAPAAPSRLETVDRGPATAAPIDLPAIDSDRRSSAPPLSTGTDRLTRSEDDVF